METKPNQAVQMNVLAAATNWAWPQALERVFQPCGVNMIVARHAKMMSQLLREFRFHAAIVDTESDSDSLGIVRAIQVENPRIPCVLLSSQVGQDLLGRALGLDVYCVLNKPVDLGILREQFNRLFLRVYRCDVFQETKRMV